VTYQLFFLHLASLNQIAAQEEAKGRNGTGWRTHEQRAAQLNEEEGRILQQVASDCNQAVKDLNEKADSVVAAFRTQHPNEESFRLPPPELVSLQDQKTIIVNSYVTDLQVKLGADAFRKLDDYIQSKFNNVSQPAPSPESRRPGGLQ